MNRWHFVLVENCKSRLFPAPSGVSQGSHLGPLLFLLMINDCPSLLKNVSILLYADDLKLFHIIKSPRDCISLQSDIDILSNWCDVNGFVLNIPKCAIMSFFRCKSPIFHNYRIGTQLIQRCEIFKDLGVIMDHKLTFNLHIDYVISKANSMLGFLKRNTREFRDLGTLNSLYFSLVRSLLEFGSVVWSPNYRSHVERIERIQKSYSRYALWRYGFVVLPPYSSRCKLLGLESLYNRRSIANCLFIFDVLSGKVKSPDLLQRVGILVPARPLRSSNFLHVPFHRVNYGCSEPLTNCIVSFNSFFSLIDFHSTRQCIIGCIRASVYNRVDVNVP